MSCHVAALRTMALTFLAFVAMLGAIGVPLAQGQQGSIEFIDVTSPGHRTGYLHVGGEGVTRNINDWYEFTLSDPRTVRFTISQLMADADLCLHNASVNIAEVEENKCHHYQGSSLIAKSSAESIMADSVRWPLQQGTYFVRIDLFTGQQTEYRLAYSSEEPPIVHVSPIQLDIEEGGSDDYVLTLTASDLTHSVRVDMRVEPANGSAGVSLSRDGVTFTVGGSRSQRITVTAEDNNRIDGERRVTIKHSVRGLLLGNEPSEADDVHVTIVDDDMATWSLGVDRASIEEDGGRAEITVSTGSATFDSDQTITLALGTNGTASEGDDYSVTSRTLTLVAGQATVSTTIVAKPDDLVEDDETIIITASTNGEAVGAAQTVTIRDDDMATWSLSVDRDYIEEVSGPPGRAQITVSTGGATFDSDQTITLALGTNGTASEGDDYSVTSRTLTLVAGQATVSTTIVAKPDDLAEDDETIIITASTNGEAVGAAQTVTIRDDDMATWSLSVDRDYIEEVSGPPGRAQITVSTGSTTFDSDQTITLALGTNGTASEGDDYSVTSRTLDACGGTGHGIDDDSGETGRSC